MKSRVGAVLFAAAFQLNKRRLRWLNTCLEWSTDLCNQIPQHFISCPMRVFRLLLLLVCVAPTALSADRPKPAPAPDAKTEQGASKSSVSAAERMARWQAAAENGETWAQFNLGLAYHLGRDVPKNELEAVKWYRAAAESGYAPAQANLGYCHDKGFGVSIDPAEAVKWYQLAAVQGNAFAQYNLAKKYQSGPGIALDPKAAEKWFKAATQQNFIPAFYSLGQIYANEFAGNTNYTEAFHYFRQAAEQGYAPAQHAIGYLYFAGKGVTTNYFEAVKWYNLAASRDFPDSHYNLGLCYQNGWGVPQNLIAAVNHFRNAAEAGHPQAQYSLGVCYYEGKGIEANFIEAYKWWNLAAVQGIPEASSSREILSRLMSESQIKEAQKRAGEFVPRGKPPAEPTTVLQTASAESINVKRIATGFLITENGFLVTNYRIVTGATNLQVVTESGSFPAALIRAEPLNDIAILKVDGGFQPLPIGPSRDVLADAPFIAIGFDGPNHGEFNPKVARGKIASLLGYQADPRQFTLDPLLTPTFGGTAVLNRRGQVVAVVLGELDEKTISESKGNGNRRSTFALKSDYLLAFLRSAALRELIQLPDSEAKNELTSEEIISRARAATALVLVL